MIREKQFFESLRVEPKTNGIEAGTSNPAQKNNFAKAFPLAPGVRPATH
jgi:hypothetical protein